MNKIYYLVSLLIISIMLSGCRSEELVKPTPALKKLKTITSGSNTSTGDVIDQTTAFEYNSDGKVSRVIFYQINTSSNDHSDTTSYTYSRDTVFAVYNSTAVNSNLQIYKYTGKLLIVLNSRGHISTSTYSVNGQGFSETYQYDKLGYCIKSLTFMALGQIVTDFKYSGGNKISSISNTGSQVISEEITYYLDKINTLIPNNSESFYDFGNENKNLIKTIHYSLTGSQDNTYSYTYEFDANNYVSKRIMTDDRGFIRWDKYTYQ